MPAGCVSGSCVDASISFADGQNIYQAADSTHQGKVRWGDYSGAALDPDSAGIWLQSVSAAETPDNWTTSAVLAYGSTAGQSA